MQPSFATLLDLLQYRAGSQTAQINATAFTFLEDGEQVSATITFAELDRRARHIAAHLQQHAQAGERVLLVYPPGIDYIAAFFGCVYAGVIAVPALPPANARTLPRLQLIAQDAQPVLAMTLESIAIRINTWHDGAHSHLQNLAWLASDQLAERSAGWVRPVLAQSDIVFLQYTSGSTGAPKGVMISHGNILANVALIHARFGIKPGEVVVSWLPPHHDMGLIGKILYPVFAGCHCVQLPPAAFLMRPWRWLKALSDYRARITAAPNFAWELCINKITEAQKQGLDLSHLEFALNGAEPIRAETVRRFATAFASCGFRPEAMTPVYGLAEATLLVSANTVRHAGVNPASLLLSKAALAADRAQACAAQEGAIEVISCGQAGVNAHRALIVDAASHRELADGQVGEVWVCGASVAAGYWQNEQASAQTFGLTVSGCAEAFMRTGDLGFMDRGELHIVGRIKEMMIINGRNIYPQDVEATAEKVDPAFRTNGCAAFLLEQEQVSRLVLIIEIEARQQAQHEGLASRIRARLAEEHALFDLAAIVLVRAGHIPRTSSGKIQRLQCRDLFINNGFAATWSWHNRVEQASAVEQAVCVAPQSETEYKLVQIWENLFDLAPVSTMADFFALGGHSLLATQLVSQIRPVFGLELAIQDLFETPVLADLARRIDAAEFATATASQLPAAPLAGREHGLPLSFAQQRLWFLDQFESGRNSYHIPVAMRLRGRLDVPALQRSLNAIVQRHESLRTVFASVDGAARQIILPHLVLDLPVLDLSAEADAEAHALRTMEAEAARPFDLAKGPLIRATLLKLADQTQMLLLTVHHIVTDGWSMGVLVRELAALYGAESSDHPARLPALALQYADFAQWQRTALEGDAARTRLDYWKNRLAGAPALLTLPTDHPRPQVQTHAGRSHRFVIPAALCQRLQDLNRDTGSTMFMTLLAAFNVLLARYSGQSDICIGTPIANRERQELEPMIGFFVNTLVLRTRLEGNPSFRTLLQQVRRHALDAYAHQDIPFDQLVEALRPERQTGHSPLFQVMLVLQNMPLQGLTLPGIELEPVKLANPTALFDLTLELEVQGEHMLACLEYDTSLFETDTMVRLAGHFVCLLESVVANPDGAVMELDWFTPDERRQVVSGWNASAIDYPRELSVHQLIERQVEHTPDHIAVVFGRQTLTYRELNQRANQLAHHLRTLGAGPESLVGICVERSLEMVTGLLAILKSGAAYVPLDPANPPDRLGYILADAQPAILLTQQALLPRLPACSAQMVCLDAMTPVLAQYPQQNLPHPCWPEQLAYIIYTSGSTGKPKGTLNTHRNVVNHTFAYVRLSGLNRDDRMIQFASINFDASVEELFHPLSVGATMVIRPVEFLGAGKVFSDWVHQYQVSLLNLPTSLWQEWMHALDDGSAWLPDCVRMVLVGGEKARIETLRAWQATPETRHVQWVNSYGPTEACITATGFVADARTTARYHEIPIGRPLMNYRVYLLDAQLEPVPVGVPGHLHIAGDGLARGYHLRPDLTAEKFIPDPFSNLPGARMYQSGDLARFLPDGNIEYLGRIDHQIKIRGYRIEPGEIEAALAALPQVRDAVVLVREDEPGVQRLVAYLVATPGEAIPDGEQMRKILLQNLPEYMIPAHFLTLASWPMNSSDKIDRKALPAPDYGQTPENYRAPATPTEQALARIWSELLKLEKISIDQDFFAIGGHSLLAVQMVSRVSHVLCVTLSLETLFGMKTIQAIAAWIDSVQAINTPAPEQKTSVAGTSRIRI